MFDKAITLKGKHAQYVKKLSKGIQNLENDKSIFKTNIALYKAAVIIGTMINRKGEEDRSNDNDTKIMPETVIKHQDELWYLFRLVMLSCKENIEDEKRIDRAFRYTYDERSNGDIKVDEEKAVKLFEAYALGGIEKLYEVVYRGDITGERYLENIFEFIKEFEDDLNHAIVEV